MIATRRGAARRSAGIAAGCGDDDDEAAASGGPKTRADQRRGRFRRPRHPLSPVREGQPPNITGYDVEVMNAIAENLGSTVEYQDTGFDTIFRDVAAGQVRHRRRGIDDQGRAREGRGLHRPLLPERNRLMVPEDSDITSTDDLGGLIVGVQDGTIQEEIANDRPTPARSAASPRGRPRSPRCSPARWTRCSSTRPSAVDSVEKKGGIEIVASDPRATTVRVRGRARQRRPARGDERGPGDDQGGRHDGGAIREVLRHRAAREVLDGTNELLTND